MTWTIERREYTGPAPSPGHVRPSRWIPWTPAAGLRWRRGVDAMRWAIAAADHRPGSHEHAAELRKLAAVRDSTIRGQQRGPWVCATRDLRLARHT